MRYMQSFQYVNYITRVEENIEAVNKLFEEDLLDFFSQASRAGVKYDVSNVDAIALTRGAYAKELQDFANELKQKTPNPQPYDSVFKEKHQQEIFLAIHLSNAPKSSIQKLMKDIRKIRTTLRLHGFRWNILKYVDYDHLITTTEPK